MASEICRGVLFQRSSKVWRITELRLSFGKIVVEAEDGDVQHLGIDQFRRECSEGEITLIVSSGQWSCPYSADGYMLRFSAFSM